MNTIEDSLLATAHGLQRGETVLAFHARMDALSQLEAAIRVGNLSGAEAASQLRELMFPSIEADRDVRRFDDRHG